MTLNLIYKNDPANPIAECAFKVLFDEIEEIDNSLSLQMFKENRRKNFKTEKQANRHSS